MDAEVRELRLEGALTSLIFPTYNPGPRLEHTWREVTRFLHRAPGRWEVFFVCDGCSDGSPQRLTEWARWESQRIRVLSYPTNRCKGYAVRQGLQAAQGQWRLFTDVDLAYSFDDILRVAGALRAGAPVAIASRTHHDSQVVIPSRLLGYVYRRHLQSVSLSFLARLLLPIRQRDTQAGLKGVSAATARYLLPRFTCDGFGFDCELLTACARLGLEVCEVPVCVRYDDRSTTTNLATARRMFQELWRIRRTWPAAAPVEPADDRDTGRREAA